MADVNTYCRLQKVYWYWMLVREVRERFGIHSSVWLRSDLSSSGKTKIQTGIFGSSTQTVKKNYIPKPFSQLADRFLKSSRNHFILPHMDYPAPRGTGGLLSQWKTGIGGERPCTSVSYHFPDVNQMVSEWETLIFSHRMQEWRTSACRALELLCRFLS